MVKKEGRGRKRKRGRGKGGLSIWESCMCLEPPQYSFFYKFGLGIRIWIQFLFHHLVHHFLVIIIFSPAPCLSLIKVCVYANFQRNLSISLVTLIVQTYRQTKADYRDLHNS